MFSVVQFVDTCDEKSSVSVVCRTWLIVRPNGIFCAWPPYTDRYQVAKAAINHANPLQSWKVYAVEKVHYETGMLLFFKFTSGGLHFEFKAEQYH